MPACRAEETSREECSMHNQINPAEEVSVESKSSRSFNNILTAPSPKFKATPYNAINSPPPRNSPIPCSESQPSSRITLWKDTSSKAKVSHIIKVEGKDISWHAFPLPLLLLARRKKAIGRHLDILNKETDQHLYLVPAYRAEETSREECSLHSQSTSITRFAFLNFTLSCFAILVMFY
ncbi:hypothetical protein ACFX13_023302 [Malus domestica]